MQNFFKNLWNNVKHGYFFARDYIADKIAKLNDYGNRLIAQADAEDNFTKRLQGLLCKAGAFLAGFAVAFTVGYTIGLVFGLLLGPVLGLLAVIPAYLIGDDFGSAVARAMISYRIATMLETHLGVTSQIVPEFAAA